MLGIIFVSYNRSHSVLDSLYALDGTIALASALPAPLKQSTSRSLSDEVLDTYDEDLYRGDMDAFTSMAILLSDDGQM